MRIDGAFRLLSHATLGLACVCLIEADELFLPGLRLGTFPVLALVGLACWAEGRWVLPAWGANVLGVAIAGGAVAWLAHAHGDETWAQEVPLHTAVVPYLGPLLIALLLVTYWPSLSLWLPLMLK